jgi:hypothetical protein
MDELLDERLAHRGRARRGHGSRYVAPGPRCHIPPEDKCCWRGRGASFEFTLDELRALSQRLHVKTIAKQRSRRSARPRFFIEGNDARAAYTVPDHPADPEAETTGLYTAVDDDEVRAAMLSAL